MLYLIGLGLNGDLTQEGVAAARRCRVYVEKYTSLLTSSIEEIERVLQRTTGTLSRRDIEETDRLLREAETTDVALLVVGDPMVATTHSEIIIEARKRNIPTKIIHNASIYSAIGETGLQIYKFGRTATIPFPQEGFNPTSFYDIIEKNRSIGAHTLVLLDIQEDKRRYMNPTEAMEILDQLRFSGNLICISRLGSDSQQILYGDISTLLSIEKDHWGQPPHCLVIPSSLHFKEEESLEAFSIEVST
ncbi:MAG: diphthine synthase [Theionarchaea archaeon]|nr:diphthine synthase [Theionarchaea archaeon]MBU7038420.1 diphthine synthase [Theionarchaea archaeon]